MDMRSPPQKTLGLSDAAAEKIKSLMSEKAPDAIGLRVGVRAKGCSGLSYAMEFAKTQRENEELVEDKGVTLLIEPTAVMYILGSEIDLKDEGNGDWSFVFENPNKTGGCGCGESFSTGETKAAGGGCCSS